MREIKFRAWDGEAMHLDVSVVDGVAIIGGHEATFWSPNAKAGQIMQYSGLKDKNGVEIYENDIVEHGYVVWHDGGFCLYSEGTNQEPTGICLDRCKRWEVIGNIYQHPELLEN